MQLLQLRRPLQIAVAGRSKPSVTFSWACLTERFAGLGLDASKVGAEGRRWASVKSQGAYRIPNKKTKPKKLGAKRTGDQYVIPGNIIYKQRGTVWHPGENTIMGRDHTIHSAVAGYVKYYRDPKRHPDRQYIGVVFDRDDSLPYPPGNPRKRKLSLLAVTRNLTNEQPEAMSPSGIPRWVVQHDEPGAGAGSPGASGRQATKDDGKKKQSLHTDTRLASELEAIKAKQSTRVLRLQKDYSYRETNWEIGRLTGPVGHVQGTEQLVSRKAKLRVWRHKRFAYFDRQKKLAAERKVRRDAHNEAQKKREAIKAKERQQLLEEEKALKAAQMAADEAKLRAAGEKTTPEA